MSNEKTLKSKGLPWQLFNKNYVVYLKLLELKAKLEFGEYLDEQTLIEKMMEIEKRDFAND